MRALLRTLHRAICRNIRRPRFFSRARGILQRGLVLATALPAAVDCHSPGDARQPGLRVFDRCQLVAVAQDAKKCFLRGVFGIVMASEGGIGDSVDEARVLPDEFFEHFISTAVLTAVLTTRYRRGLVQAC